MYVICVRSCCVSTDLFLHVHVLESTSRSFFDSISYISKYLEALGPESYSTLNSTPSMFPISTGACSGTNSVKFHCMLSGSTRYPLPYSIATKAPSIKSTRHSQPIVFAYLSLFNVTSQQHYRVTIQVCKRL